MTPTIKQREVPRRLGYQHQGTMLSCRQRLSTASMYLLDMVKDYITRTRASIKGAGAVLKARDTAGRALVV